MVFSTAQKLADLCSLIRMQTRQKQKHWIKYIIFAIFHFALCIVNGFHKMKARNFHALHPATFHTTVQMYVRIHTRTPFEQTLFYEINHNCHLKAPIAKRSINNGPQQASHFCIKLYYFLKLNTWIRNRRRKRDTTRFKINGIGNIVSYWGRINVEMRTQGVQQFESQ